MGRLLFLQELEYEFLGPMYLSSALREAGHSCRLALGKSVDDFAAVIQEFRPNLVGFSIMSGSHKWAREIAAEVKRRYGLKTIFGGAHPTFFPQFGEHEAVDYVVRGEGEDAIVDVMNALDRGDPLDAIPNLGLKVDGKLKLNDLRPLPRDLDHTPYPDRHLYDALDGRVDRGVRNVLTSRGCPWHCAFCFEDAMRDLYEGKGKYVRIRRIDRVLEECEQVRAAGARVIYFADDVFGMNRKWLYEFLPEYRKKIGLPFICLVRADLVSADAEYAKRLADGGCRSVFFGIESGNERLRNNVLGKDLTDSEIVRAAKMLHEAGIAFRAYNIVGLPGESLDDAFATVELNIRVGTDYPWCSLFSPFPGTALAKLAADLGYLDAAFEPDQLAKSFFTTTPLALPHARELENLQKLFQTAVLWPSTWPVVKRLVRLPPNPAFTAWFGLVYLHVYARSEQRDLPTTLRFAARNFKHVLLRE